MMKTPAKPGATHEQPPLDLKHLIWILDWARDACAKSIEQFEHDVVRHSAFGANTACTKYGYKDRAQEQMRLDHAITEYRRIYDWIDGAKAQAMSKSNEEFARDMAAYFGGKQ